MSLAEYFKIRVDGAKDHPILKPLNKPCHDCAVICDFYKEISDDLKSQPDDIRKSMSDKWFCHNHPDRACAGNWINQGYKI